MLDKLPVEVEPLSLAIAGRSFVGKLAIKKFERLSGLLNSREGYIDVQLVFEVNDRRLPVMRGKVSGQVELICQRCADPMSIDIETDFLLALLTSKNETAELPDGYESLLVSGQPVMLSDLMEDEIILALPLIPKHSDQTLCQAFVEQKETVRKETNPFAVLEKLKGNN